MSRRRRGPKLLDLGEGVLSGGEFERVVTRPCESVFDHLPKVGVVVYDNKMAKIVCHGASASPRTTQLFVVPRTRHNFKPVRRIM